MGKNVIEIQNLTKNYGKNRGVTNLTLNVEEGEIFGFLGPNGAGKSTTIRSMLGLARFQEGEIKLLEYCPACHHLRFLPPHCPVFPGQAQIPHLR